MFEDLQNEAKGEQEERAKMMKMTGIIVGVILVVGVVVYLATRGSSKPAASAATQAAATQTAPDALKDLKVIRAVMGKDPTGLRVLWSVQVKNRSAVYTYSDLQYEARFITVDGKTIATTRDTIKDSVAPGEDKSFPPFMGGTYDANASAFQFALLGATSSK